jgi:hypothetical protein
MKENAMFSLSIRNHLETMLILFTCLIASISFTAHADTSLTPKVKEAMSAMKAEANKLGEPKLDGESLFFGTTKINGDFTLVDALKTKFGGTATFFVKKGDAFVRISTNVMKEGNRAVGTSLDPAGPAIAAIRQGKAFYGIVDILGKMYDTGYEPIKTKKGDVIGIYYVGQSLE